MFQTGKYMDLFIIFLVAIIFWVYPSPPFLFKGILYLILAAIVLKGIIHEYKSGVKEYNDIKKKAYQKYCLPIREEHKTEHSLNKQICGDQCNKTFLSQFSPFPQYKETKWSILDAIPPPDPFHEYRCDGFNKEKTNKTDYDRWASQWQANEEYSIKYLDLSNNFYV
jgi:hypothetical protein